MAQAIELFFDETAERAVRSMRQSLRTAGIAEFIEQRPHVTLAAAGSIPSAALDAVTTELRRLSLPELWLSTLGAFLDHEPALLLSAIVDTEVLAVHTTVHDCLAGKVSKPVTRHLPGAWIPHCALAERLTRAQLSTGFETLLPLRPIRAPIREVGVRDTRDDEVRILVRPGH